MSMNVKRARFALSLLCVAWLTFGTGSSSLFSQPASMMGTVAGRVIDKATKTSLAGVTVSAQLITTSERFSSRETDSRGTYLISAVPTGIYVFFLDYRGTEYPVAAQLDVRTFMRFLLESCFELDRDAGTASLLQECRSGWYAETEVATLGPHRFLRPESSPAYQDETSADPDLDSSAITVQHEGLDCIVTDRFPLLSAGIQPGTRVQSSRVYFRAAQHPDFYYVEMMGTYDDFQAILPKPTPETQQVIYYIEAVDLDFDNALTPEHAPEVTDDDSCRKRRPAAAYFTGENPEIVVGATVAGAPAVPLGFEAAGITGFISATGVATGVVAAGAGAGAGLGASGGVIIVAGGAAAAAGAVAATINQVEASPVR